jgi:ABC-2 type transport system ATP-binding protein
VRSVATTGDGVMVLTDDAERVVRELLARDPGLSHLEVAAASLEEAFLTLTAQENPHVDVAHA